MFVQNHILPTHTLPLLMHYKTVRVGERACFCGQLATSSHRCSFNIENKFESHDNTMIINIRAWNDVYLRYACVYVSHTCTMLSVCPSESFRLLSICAEVFNQKTATMFSQTCGSPCTVCTIDKTSENFRRNHRGGILPLMTDGPSIDVPWCRSCLTSWKHIHRYIVTFNYIELLNFWNVGCFGTDTDSIWNCAVDSLIFGLGRLSCVVFSVSVS